MNEPTVYDFTNKNEFDFDKYLINLADELPEPRPLVRIGGKPAFSRGNLSCVSGKAKSRKTFLLTLLASEFLNEERNSKLILFDTEMARFHTAKIAKRIHRLMEWDEAKNNECLKVFSLRELSTEERRSLVKAAIEKFRPDLVFIDGIRDLAIDFNNPGESSDLVNELMKISSVFECHICSVLHENKAANTLRGHLGTELVNKSETVISVESVGDISKVSAAYCRNIPFDDFYFRVNDGLPEYCEATLKPKKEENLKSLFEELLPATILLSYADLRQKVMDKTGKAVRTAERYIKDAIENDIIKKNPADMYLSVDNNKYSEENDEKLPF